MRELEQKLGYCFQDARLLEHALVHSSYANEHKSGPEASNERLEFLGDAVLGMVAAEYLFSTRRDVAEGELTRTRATLVCEASLCAVARRIRLGEHLLLGKGEQSGGGRSRPSILADAMEAVFAAVFLDGGFQAAQSVITRLVLEQKGLETVPVRDCKTALQEVVQREAGHVLRYELVSESGPDHQKQFTCAVLLDEAEIGRGTGRSKKEAEQLAAAAALEKIEG